jgi:hypothetical protein
MKTAGNTGRELPRLSEEAVLDLMQEHVRRHSPSDAPDLPAIVMYSAESRGLPFELEEAKLALEAVLASQAAVGQVNPRRPGRYNDAVQFGKRLVARLLGWHTRSFFPFHTAVAQALEQQVRALTALSQQARELERRQQSIEQRQRQLEQRDQQLETGAPRRESIGKRFEDEQSRLLGWNKGQR